MNDSGNRTEKPTPRRIERARKEGSFVASRELTGAVQFAVFAVLGLYGAAPMAATVVNSVRSLIRAAFSPGGLTVEGVSSLLREKLALPAMWLAGAGLIVSAAAVLSQLAATRFGIAANRLFPDVERLNPLSRLQELGPANLTQVVKSALLLPVFVGAAAWFVWEHAPELISLSAKPWWAGASAALLSIRELAEWAMYLFIGLGFFDWIRQHRKYLKRLRMTKQEIRDEQKEAEGNPQIKAKVRRMQREMSRRRMMAGVPLASAVIINPTHYAVAILYEMGSMAAPKVVAKGRNHVARRIRDLARSHDVPIIENPPLARALFGAAEVGQEIPPHLYRAVAEILGYLYRLLGGRLPGQAYA